jgi:hypothetical protein
MQQISVVHYSCSWKREARGVADLQCIPVAWSLNGNWLAGVEILRGSLKRSHRDTRRTAARCNAGQCRHHKIEFGDWKDSPLRERV